MTLRLRGSVDTFSFLAPKDINLLHIVQVVVHSNIISPRSMNALFTMIGFAIQKGLTILLSTYLPYMCNFHVFYWIQIKTT